MPLDPSIILGTKAPDIDPVGVAEKALSMKSLMNRNQIQTQQISDDQAVRSAYQFNTQIGPDGAPHVDQAGVMSDLLENGHAPAAIQEHAKMIQQQNAVLDQKLKTQTDQANLYHSLAWSVPTDKNTSDEYKEAAYQNMLQKAQQAGLPNTDKLAPNYPGDEAWKQTQFNTLSSKDQFEQISANRKAATEQQQADTASFAAGAPKRAGAPGVSESAGKKALDDPNTDPATLMVGRVPTSQQKEIATEIKNRQDIAALAPKILAAFDKGNSRNPNTAAIGRSEFEALINTTVQEQEGTVRKAAMDNIHDNMAPKGTFALPGQNAARRRTVIEYMTSKGSAPLSKKAGIDLDKYKSTKLSFGTVQMRDPKGNIRAVPESMVEAAKKAGGTEL